MKLYATKGPGPLWWKIRTAFRSHSDQDKERQRIQREGLDGPLMDPDYVGPVLPEHVALWNLKTDDND